MTRSKSCCSSTIRSKGAALGSQPTLSRFENAVGRADLYRLGTALADTVLTAHRERLGDGVRLITIDLNQLRLLFSVAAYALFQVLQNFARATSLGAAQVWTLRERLVKVSVWVERSVRRIVLHLPRAFPRRHTWHALAQVLTAT
jgi:hypothetical protein